MFRVLSCVFQQHDLRLVVLAGCLCLFACASALAMLRRAHAAQGTLRLAWIAAAGAVAGFGIWGTHFVAMLAYAAGFPVGYDWWLTVLSAVIAVTLCGVGFAIALSRAGALVGGAVTGAAIGAMHYVGMAAVRAPADAIWDWRYVVSSAVIGIVMTALGMAFALRRDTSRSYLAGAGIFTLAICSLHFTGMTAVIYRYNPTVLPPAGVMDPVTLAVAVAAIAVLIIAGGMIGALLDSHLALRAVDEAERLRRYVADLEATKGKLEETSKYLAAALEQADAANEAKSRFLAAMSHELRTPLNAVIGFADMLALEMFGPLGAERYRSYVGDIKRSGMHLLSLVNDILDTTRLDAGQLELTDEALVPLDLVQNALHMVEAQAEAGGIALVCAVAPDLPLVRADKRRLTQVLLNLLSNAIKFTHEGGTVRIAAERTESGLSLSVCDTGIGIAREDLARALERFGQVDTRLARKFEGSGLGLPLARSLMELHGGKLVLESEELKGTSVTVTLPRERIVVPERFAA